MSVPRCKMYTSAFAFELMRGIHGWQGTTAERRRDGDHATAGLHSFVEREQDVRAVVEHVPIRRCGEGGRLEIRRLEDVPRPP